MSTLDIAKRLDAKHNVCFRVIDAFSGKEVSRHMGHNAATNSLLTGIGNYLTGNAVLNQGQHMLLQYVPQYISLGTMGLMNQEQDAEGLPIGIGTISYDGMRYSDLTDEDRSLVGKTSSQYDGQSISEDDKQILRYTDYMLQPPGFGADGYDFNTNNNRPYLGLGPDFANRASAATINCELISPSFPRAQITFRDVVPESEAEFSQTIDVVFSAMISTGALAQFREPGKDYIFITEAGLWGRKDWVDGGDNGLLAGYRIAPPNQNNWSMAPVEDDLGGYVISPEQAAENRRLLRENIIRVGVNQVVQIIWKVQLGGLDQFGGLHSLPGYDASLEWIDWDARVQEGT